METISTSSDGIGFSTVFPNLNIFQKQNQVLNAVSTMAVAYCRLRL